MSAPENIELLCEAARVVPGFAPIHAEHVHDDGEVLPHVLMADLVRHIEDRAAGGDLAPAVAALALVQGAYESGVPYLQELVSVSFLENLDRLAPVYDELKRRMGEPLLAELRLYEATGWGTLPPAAGDIEVEEEGPGPLRRGGGFG